MVLARLIALSLAGPAHEEAPAPGFTPVISHFTQLNLSFRLWLACRAATQSSTFLNAEHTSFRSVRAGNTPWACNCEVSFLSSSLFAASCSLAVLESFLNARAGLYRLGLYQCFGLDVSELCPAPGEPCAAAASAPNSNPATVTATAIKCFLICVPSRAWALPQPQVGHFSGGLSRLCRDGLFQSVTLAFRSGSPARLLQEDARRRPCIVLPLVADFYP